MEKIHERMVAIASNQRATRHTRLDVQQATVVACLLMVRKDGRVQKQMRTFGTATRELVGLREWLLSEGCTP